MIKLQLIDFKKNIDNSIENDKYLLINDDENNVFKIGFGVLLEIQEFLSNNSCNIVIENGKYSLVELTDCENVCIYEYYDNFRRKKKLRMVLLLNNKYLEFAAQKVENI